MIVKNKSGHVLNTDKPWCIEWCCRHQQFLDQSPYWEYWKSYKTFNAVVDAYCDLQNHPFRLTGTVQRMYYRIANTNFTGYKEFTPLTPSLK
jgi:hypothetical protein